MNQKPRNQHQEPNATSHATLATHGAGAGAWTLGTCSFPFPIPVQCSAFRCWMFDVPFLKPVTSEPRTCHLPVTSKTPLSPNPAGAGQATCHPVTTCHYLGLPPPTSSPSSFSSSFPGRTSYYELLRVPYSIFPPPRARPLFGRCYLCLEPRVLPMS